MKLKFYVVADDNYTGTWVETLDQSRWREGWDDDAEPWDDDAHE